MQAIILAAGKGTRMRPLTYDIPKPMLPIKGKPILAHTLSFLPEEVDEVIFVINYLGEHIQKYFGDSFDGKKIRYVTQRELNGTGGAINDCKDLIKGKFLVLMGDDLYYRKDLAKLVKEDVAVLALETDEPERFGIFKTDQEGNALDIIECPEKFIGNMANIGAYVISPDFFDYPLVPKKAGDKEFGLPQTLVQMKDKHQIKVIKAQNWLPVGRPEDLAKAEKEIEKFVK